MTPPACAVVFAYHTVGVRCLSVLLAYGVRIPLIISHQDDPGETIWFDSVAKLAQYAGIPVITPDSPNTQEVIQQIKNCRPDFIFSFYYRHMLNSDLLAIPTCGCYNMHGSLLPKYRGRVPVNWAVLHGESETGATLHRMEIKPDAGDMVGQQAVKIQPNDTAHQVFGKVVCAAESLLGQVLPDLLSGLAVHHPIDLTQGSYFGGRRPQDGRIDWQGSAWQIHNLIRAVAPPYPGAFFDFQGTTIQVLGSYFKGDPARYPSRPCLYWEEERCWVDCRDGLRLQLTCLAVQGTPLNRDAAQRLLPGTPVFLPV